ncbi:acid protease [Coprinopsis marcescibilis]|uniref:Acid protease n=1 Tax=Coprinopsis marcescibilis TaxID=230819 RepID=A0A5C3L6F1_COPMA|nr:acid protease [Coprinopsis marcescibilis]
MWPPRLLLSLVALHTVAAWDSRALVPRSDLVTLPIHSLQARDNDNNNATHAGLAPVSFSSDRQSYTVIIRIGEINFRVALDTGSSDLWVVSSECETAECRRVPRYPLAYQSPTFVIINGNETQFEARYADGTAASGFLAKERVQFPNINVTDQVFGLASQSDLSFADQTSGILGLGFPRLTSFPNVTNSAPFFPTLAQRGLLDYPLFALSLTRNNSGSLSIGAIDASIVKDASDIAWNNVASFSPFPTERGATEPSYLQWAIPLSGFSVNNTANEPIPTYPRIHGGATLALIDVGSAGIHGPVQDVSRIYSAIEGARIVDPAIGQWAIPCDTDVPMSFAFGSRNYTLLPQDYIIGRASGNPNLCLSWPRAQPPSADGIDWQFGTPFLRTIYSIYSFGINTKEPPLIGFYSIRNETLLSTTLQTPEEIASFLSENGHPVETTLPNVILPTPSYTTPAYAFNTTASAGIGAIYSTQLATSTYNGLFAGQTTVSNISAIPTIAPLATHTITDSAGKVNTVVSAQSQLPSDLTLGVPAGWIVSGSLCTLYIPSYYWTVLLAILSILYAT